MTPELIAIIAVGVALAGLMLRTHQGLGKRIDALDRQFDNRMGGFDKRIDGFDERLRSIEIGQAELKGTILGELHLITRYIVSHNLLGDNPAPQTSGARPIASPRCGILLKQNRNW